jgi:RNA polymerase sigma-70 factor (ECF subfamily)
LSLTRTFQDLYQAYSSAVLRAALRVTGSHEDAEDVLQTVFLRVLHSGGTLDETQAPERYLRRAATNAAIDLLRRKAAHKEMPLEAVPEPSGPESTALLKERMRRALAKLDPEDAQMFVLRNLEGLSYEELADQFQVERGTVASRLHRSRHELMGIVSR